MYKIFVIIEVIFCALSFIVPAISGKDYLADGMSEGSVYTITDDKFQVSFKSAKRAYSDTLNLSDEEIANMQVKCTSQKGKVTLKIEQDGTEKKIDIGSLEGTLDMPGFHEGYIVFTMSNENAKNV